jgi:hypothetical protein
MTCENGKSKNTVVAIFGYGKTMDERATPTLTHVPLFGVLEKA